MTPQIIYEASIGSKGGRARASPIHSPPPTESDSSPPAVTEGMREAAKDAAKERERSDLKFEQIINKSNHVLFTVSAFFPFDLFPDKIIIDVEKVSIIKRIFFWTERVQSVAIKDVADVFVDTSILFATLRIVDRFYYENNVRVEYLKKSEAFKARRIIEGLLLASREGIDLSKLPQVTIKDRITELGAIATKDQPN